MCQAYGELRGVSAEHPVATIDKEKPTYGMMDGSMVLTREGNWSRGLLSTFGKEVKD